MKKRIRVQGALIFFAIVLFLIFDKFVIPDWKKEPIEEFFDILGIIMILFGFLLRIIARGYKEDQTHGGHVLVIDGPYCLLRNPMYFATMVIGMGVISVLFKLWALPIFLAVYLSIYIPQVNREEKILSERFGKEYKDYCKATPKYFPYIWRLSELKKYISLIKASWLKKESVSLILTLIIVFIIEIWQDIRLFGFKGFLVEFLELILVVLLFFLITLFIWYWQRNKKSILRKVMVSRPRK